MEVDKIHAKLDQMALDLARINLLVKDLHSELKNRDEESRKSVSEVLTANDIKLEILRDERERAEKASEFRVKIALAILPVLSGFISWLVSYLNGGHK